MRWYQRSGAAAASVWVGLGLAFGVVLGAGGASAASTMSSTFTVQLGPQKTGTYGTVDVTEAGGGFDFLIRLDRYSLGPKADLHEFYFNLPDTYSNVTLSPGGLCGGATCHTPFQLDAHKSTRGGAGANSDYRVSFGNGAGEKGNGRLQEASFHIDATSALQLYPSSPFDPSFTSRHLEVIFAAHVPGSRGVAATIGATELTVVPEPATGVIFGVGLVGLAWVGRRRRAD